MFTWVGGKRVEWAGASAELSAADATDRPMLSMVAKQPWREMLPVQTLPAAAQQTAPANARLWVFQRLLLIGLFLGLCFQRFFR